MAYIRYSFFTLFILILSIGCNEHSSKFFSTETVIIGNIQNADEGKIIFKGFSEKTIELDSSGDFSFSVDLSESGIYALQYKYMTTYLYIEPGDSIYVNTDYKANSEAQINGDHSVENSYLQIYVRLKDELINEDFVNIFKLNETDFTKRIEQISQSLIEHQQLFQKENDVFTHDFGELLNNDISYEAAEWKMIYPFYYEYFSPDSVLQLSENYDSFLQNIELNDKRQLLTPSFRSFLNSYIDFYSERDTVNKDKSVVAKKIDFIDYNFTNKTIREILFFNVMENSFNEDPNAAAAVVNNYQRLQTNKLYKAKIDTVYQTWKHLLKGEKAPNWQYVDIHGQTVESSSLDGKVVYIDVWATWCGPCLREHPYLEALQDSLKDQDIEFVGISIDNDKSAWENMLKNKKFKGVQVFADKAWNSSIVEDYNIMGIPRFIIIDRDGNIINANAPRPSDTKTKDILVSATL